MKATTKSIIATFLLIPVFTGLAEDKKDQPNIILIMVDDMGFSDLGYHGGEIQTPNLDLLAQNGVNGPWPSYGNHAGRTPFRGGNCQSKRRGRSGIGRT